MEHKTTLAPFNGQDGLDLYVGIDVGKKNWKVSILSASINCKTFSQKPDPVILQQYLRRNFPTARPHVAYEAGFSGYWTAHQLHQLGIDCIVVNPADIPTSDKERQFKNDVRDCRKIARALRAAELTPLYIPSAQALEDRQLVRARTAMVKKQTRVKNQIKGLLAFHGIILPEQSELRHWSRRFLLWMEQLVLDKQTLRQAFDGYLRELGAIRTNIAILTRQIRELAHSERYHRHVELLVSVPGISTTSAMVLLSEIIDIGRFRDLDHLASYVSLVPGTHSSGESERTTGMTHRGNKAVAIILIECSWVAIRHDPELLAKFEHTCRRMPKNRAIVVIARRLLSRIHHVLSQDEPYRINNRKHQATANPANAPVQ